MSNHSVKIKSDHGSATSNTSTSSKQTKERNERDNDRATAEQHSADPRGRRHERRRDPPLPRINTDRIKESINFTTWTPPVNNEQSDFSSANRHVSPVRRKISTSPYGQPVIPQVSPARNPISTSLLAQMQTFKLAVPVLLPDHAQDQLSPYTVVRHPSGDTSLLLPRPSSDLVKDSRRLSSASSKHSLTDSPKHTESTHTRHPSTDSKTSGSKHTRHTSTDSKSSNSAHVRRPSIDTKLILPPLERPSLSPYALLRRPSLDLATTIPIDLCSFGDFTMVDVSCASSVEYDSDS